MWSKWWQRGFEPRTETSQCAHKNWLRKWPLKEDTSLPEQLQCQVRSTTRNAPNAAVVKPATVNQHTQPVGAASYSHLWLRRLPLYMVMMRRGKHRCQLWPRRAHFASALSLCPKIDRVAAVLPAPATPDRTICQTVPGGALTSNSALCSECRK